MWKVVVCVQIDELTADLLRLYPKMSQPEIMAVLAPQYGQDQVAEVLLEVEKARAEGTLGPSSGDKLGPVG